MGAGGGEIAAGGGESAAGQGQLGQLQVGIRRLQHIATALGNGQRLSGQALRLGVITLVAAQPRQVDQDVGFKFNQIDVATAGQRFDQMLFSGGAVTLETLGGPQQPVGLHVVAFDGVICTGIFICQFQGAAGGGEGNPSPILAPFVP